MSSPSFAVTRANGRSNASVLVDYFRSGKPGDVYTFDQLSTVLSDGARKFRRDDVRKAVGSAYSRILKDLQRAVTSVRGVGYRIVQASEHQALAGTRKRRADVQLLRGLQTLKNVRLEEMEENARLSHEGMLLVVGALYQNQQAMERRLTRVEAAIEAAQKK